MKKATVSFIMLILVMLPLGMSQANCDISRFRWDCEMAMNIKPKPSAPSLIYCGRTFGYITQADYDTLQRYQRENVNLDITVNGEYVDGPCIPAGR